jgi:hypothetical protein
MDIVVNQIGGAVKNEIRPGSGGWAIGDGKLPSAHLILSFFAILFL